MLLLSGARLTDGRAVDVRLCGERIDAVAPAGTLGAPERVDLTGYLLLPAPADPHTHLDEAFSADPAERRPEFADPGAGRGAGPGAGPGPDAGAGRGAGSGPHAGAGSELPRRVIEAALTGLGYGATAQRTHVLVDGAEGHERLLASLQAARDLHGLMELQVVAVTATGDLAALRAALDEGADAVGGAGRTDPHAVLALGAREGVPVDLHTTAVLAAVPEGVSRLLLCGPDRAPAGADLCVLPQGSRCVLGAAGPSGTVAGSGALRDAANGVGRADPLESAFLLAARSGLRPEAAYARVSAAARRALGLRPTAIEPGSPAELLAVRGLSLGAALSAGHSRVVVHRGRIVSRTSAVREFSDPVPAPPPLPRQNSPR